MRSSLGKLGGGLKAGCKPPMAKREGRRPLPAQPHGHIARQDELFQQPRIVERGVERCRALIEIEHADGVHLQAHQIVVPSGQNGRDLAQNQQPQTRAKLQHQAQIRGDERRCAPGDAQHRSEQMMVTGHWEDGLQRAEDLGGVADRVRSETARCPACGS